MERYHNPFQAIDISVPVQFKDDYLKYCQTKTDGTRTIIDQSPFPRMVDMWFLAICIATKLNLESADISKYETYKIIEGSIFSSDPWRINALILIAISKTKDVEIVTQPRKIMTLVNGLAVTGMRKMLEMLKDSEDDPIWNLSESLDSLFRENN